jgi:hypothetical protein
MRVFPFILATLWYLMSIYLSTKIIIYTKTWVSGTGNVVGHQSTQGKSRSCVAVIEYQDGKKTTNKFTSHNASIPCPFEIGLELPILYSGSKPNSAIINTGYEKWLGPSVSFLVASIFLGLGILSHKIMNTLRGRQFDTPGATPK